MMDIKDIKHEFMAFRNGIVADALRSVMPGYNVIFGLQLPQITEIARKAGKNEDLADALWADRRIRESRILAPFLYPLESIDRIKALSLASEVQTPEEADILAFRLLRYLPFAPELPEEIEKMDNAPLAQYMAMALRRNLEA